MTQRLTRAEMEQVIGRKGSVMYAGRIITRVEDLPSAADLAVGDPAAEKKTAEDIDAEIARLVAEKAKLGKSGMSVEDTKTSGEPESSGAGGQQSEPSDEDKVLAQNVPDVAAYVAKATDAAELERLLAAENDREVPRKGVTSAIEARLEELKK